MVDAAAEPAYVRPVDVYGDSRVRAHVGDPVDVLLRGQEGGDYSGTGELYLMFDEKSLAIVFVEAVADLLFFALVDAYHAPAHVIVDGGGLPGLPDYNDDAEAAVRGDVQDVLPEAVSPLILGL